MDPEYITHVAGLPFLSEDAEFDQCVQFASGGGFAEGDPFADFLEAEAPVSFAFIASLRVFSSML